MNLLIGLLSLVAVYEEFQLDEFHMIGHFHELCQEVQPLQAFTTLQYNLQWSLLVHIRDSSRVNPAMIEMVIL